MSSCWRWCGAVTGSGYGHLSIDGELVKAHRFVWEITHGPIPPGLEIDHLCRVRNCVNPDHMELVTHKENINRGLRGRMVTHCPQGHEYTSDTLLSKPRRDCKVCHAKRERDRRGRVKRSATPVE